MSEYFTPEQQHEKAWTDYVATAPTPEMLQERLTYWEEQLAVAEKFKAVAEHEVGRLGVLLGDLQEETQ